MNLSKKTAIIGITALTSIAVMSSLVFGRDGLLSVAKATNDPYTMVLNKDTNTGLGNSFSNGTFSVNTPTGQSNVTFEYKNGKAKENGLITLNKTFLGNPRSDSPLYIGNTKPITGIESINVSMGEGILTVFGSPDNTEWYRLDILTATGTLTTSVSNYFWFRFANGNQDMTALDINSITFNYSCVQELFTDDTSDKTSSAFLMGNKSYCEVVNNKHMSRNNSTKSLKIYKGEDTGSSMQFVARFPSAITGAQFKKMQIEFYLNNEDATNYDNNHKFTRVTMYPENSWSKYSSYYVRHEIANGSDWTKIYDSFESMSGLADDAVVTGIWFDVTYLATYCHFDNMRITYCDNYPTFDTTEVFNDPCEINDISNTSYVNSSNTNDGGVEFEIKSENSLCSRKIVYGSSSDGRFGLSGFATNAHGKIISIDIKMDEFPSSAYAKFLIMDGENQRVEVSARYGTEAGVTKTALTGDYEGWVRIVIDVDVATEGKTHQADKSAVKDYGIYMSHVANCNLYIDNLFIDSPAVEI